MRVGAVPMFDREKLVEAELRGGFDRGWDFEAELAQPRGADLDEKARDGLDVSFQVREAGPHEIRPWQS